MVKITTSEVKRGTILKIEGKLFKVTEMSHTHMGRGGATDSFKVKDIVSGKTNVFTYNAGTVLEQAEVNTKNAIFLYNSGNSYSFMENDSGEMYEIEKEEIDDVVDYLKENLDVYLMIYEGNVIGVILPATITYKITSTVPGVKGDRAQAGKKPATIETGLEIMVPLNKNEGDSIIVNTETGTAS
ncbi:elongation factor P [Candidatus Gracilibacteria bacterium]|nr:elongation factor P [Candidatus Gracilibacteria bacterium]